MNKLESLKLVRCATDMPSAHHKMFEFHYSTPPSNSNTNTNGNTKYNNGMLLSLKSK